MRWSVYCEAACIWWTGQTGHVYYKSIRNTNVFESTVVQPVSMRVM
jgi:hypothetical protein